MSWLDRLHHADVATEEALGRYRDHPLVRVTGWASEIADQPQLVTICLATAAAGVLTRNRKLTRTGLGMLSAELLATTMKSVIKRRVDRTRPYVPQDGDRYELKAGDDQARRMNSFPSGHTAGAVAVAGVIGRSYPQHRKAAYALATAIAAVQLPRARHYPGDLAAGAMIGLIAGAAATWMTRSIEEQLNGAA